MQTDACRALNPKLIYINYYQCEAGFQTNPRYLVNPYLLYVYGGKGKFQIGNNTYVSAPGDLYFCPRGIPNTISADKEEPFLLTGIDFYFSQESAGSNLPLPEKINIANARFRWLLSELITSYETRFLYQDGYSSGLLKALICTCLQESEQKGESIPEADTIPGYLIQHKNEDITNTELARVFGYHPNHINRILHRLVGTSAKQYVLALRLSDAYNLLLYSGRSIGEIAEACGFHSIYYFSRLFKEKYGCSPSSFRKKYGIH